MRIVVLTSVLTLTLGLPAVTWAQARTAAQPRPDAKPAATSRATVEQIAGWVQELTSRDFQARRAASRRLVAAGKAVIGKVSEAADGSDLERTTRCLYVLKKLQGSEDKATKAAAGAALKKLAGSKNSTVARRAQAALPKADPKPAARPSTLQGFRIIGLQAANRISVSVVNGQRTIEVKEGTGKILIQDNNGKQIRMEITSRVKGRLQIRKVKAATEEALTDPDPGDSPRSPAAAPARGAAIETASAGVAPATPLGMASAGRGGSDERRRGGGQAAGFGQAAFCQAGAIAGGTRGIEQGSESAHGAARATQSEAQARRRKKVTDPRETPSGCHSLLAGC